MEKLDELAELVQSHEDRINNIGNDIKLLKGEVNLNTPKKHKRNVYIKESIQAFIKELK